MWTCAETPRHPLALPRLCALPPMHFTFPISIRAPRVPAHTKVKTNSLSLKSHNDGLERAIYKRTSRLELLCRVVWCILTGGLVPTCIETLSCEMLCLASRVGPKEKLRASGANAPAVSLAPSATSTDLRLSHEALQ